MPSRAAGYVADSSAIAPGVHDAYDAYGNRAVLTPQGNTSNEPAKTAYGHTGRWHDEETGLQYFRARYFDSELGRFVGRDPAEYIDGMSMYSGYFVPLAMDPTGQARYIFRGHPSRFSGGLPIVMTMEFSTEEQALQFLRSLINGEPGMDGHHSWTYEKAKDGELEYDSRAIRDQKPPGYIECVLRCMTVGGKGCENEIDNAIKSGIEWGAEGYAQIVEHRMKFPADSKLRKISDWAVRNTGGAKRAAKIARFVGRAGGVMLAVDGSLCSLNCGGIKVADLASAVRDYVSDTKDKIIDEYIEMEEQCERDPMGFWTGCYGTY
ncbi:MAG: RHS repeat-associated core domain-containing protein [Phaeodactylibacter sp.]|nr:RHS repeat-associated core domain-containing protein [Phaeodactylibacter sp.]